MESVNGWSKYIIRVGLIIAAVLSPDLLIKIGMERCIRIFSINPLVPA